MRNGAGPGRTRADHLDVAAQLLSALARARQVRDLAELIGVSGLSRTDQAYLDLEQSFRTEVLGQSPGEARTLDDTLDRVWRVLLRLPRSELSMLPASLREGR
jgi:V/A-type H+-transporting ATPase subunit B